MSTRITLDLNLQMSLFIRTTIAGWVGAGFIADTPHTVLVGHRVDRRVMWDFNHDFPRHSLPFVHRTADGMARITAWMGQNSDDAARMDRVGCQAVQGGVIGDGAVYDAANNIIVSVAGFEDKWNKFLALTVLNFVKMNLGHNDLSAISTIPELSRT